MMNTLCRLISLVLLVMARELAYTTHEACFLHHSKDRLDHLTVRCSRCWFSIQMMNHEENWAGVYGVHNRNLLLLCPRRSRTAKESSKAPHAIATARSYHYLERHRHQCRSNMGRGD